MQVTNLCTMPLVGNFSRAGKDMIKGLPFSHRRIILKKSVAGVGMKAEEVQVRTHLAMKLCDKGSATLPNLKTLKSFVDDEGNVIERTPELLADLAQKRESFWEPFWCIHATMLNFRRRRYGPTKEMAVPIDRLDIANRSVSLLVNRTCGQSEFCFLVNERNHPIPF